MDLIRLAIARPVAVLSAVLMVVMFGAVGLTTIPVQLTPDIRPPVISVRTDWPGAAPADVEREIVIRQENALKGLEGLREMTARARTGRAEITLEFSVDTDMTRALLLVSNRLSVISGLPDEADQPRLATATSDDNPIGWFSIVRQPGNPQPIDAFGTLVDEVVKDRLERIAGVSLVNIYGGAARELRVTVLPERLAAYGLTVPDVLDALRAADVSASAGDVDEGKRRYVVRVEGALDTPRAVGAVVLRAEGGARVTVGDVADIAFAIKDAEARRRFLGAQAIPFNVVREQGANVMETMDAIQATVAELNAGPLAGAGLKIIQTFDETVYIRSAIDLVITNIYVGGALAACVLFLFLRRVGPTLVVGMAIPVSLVGAFVGMAALGQSLNVISLAGLAFAVGMVVDAAIVVLENIYRLREAGASRAEAAYRGARQVWGAVLISALTTVLAFAPILVLTLEVGQLFRDIAVAISVAVMLSLVVAVTVVPALARRLLGPARHADDAWRVPVIDPFARAFVDAVGRLARAATAHAGLAAALVGGLCAVAALTAGLLMPKLEYLPEGNRNQVSGSILLPPGYNLDASTAVGEAVAEAVRPLWPQSATGVPPDPAAGPAMASFFYVARETHVFLSATAEDPARVGDLVPALRAPALREPGAFALVSQPSLFGRSVGSGRSIDLDILGGSEADLVATARRAADLVETAMPRAAGHQLRPRPGLELGAPELRITPDPVRLRDAGLSARDYALTVDAFNDGVRVREITVDGTRVDLTLAGPRDHVRQTQGIAALPVVVEGGRILPAGALGAIAVTAGPMEILHTERQRSITLQIRPAAGMPLEEAMDRVRDQVMAPLQDGSAVGGPLPPGVSLRLAGTADRLSETWGAMQGQILLSVVVVYLVMAVLFESFVYPLLILVTVPLAGAGGLAGLALANALIAPAPLDMLTLLGFIILIGTVVNNAILVVHQTLTHLREDGMSPAEAIEAATRNRVRPIFMSTLTTLCGMAPLVVFPGAGSELYRGLGAVVLGGMAVSTLLTLVMMPPLLGLTVRLTELRRGRRQDQQRRSRRAGRRQPAQPVG